MRRPRTVKLRKTRLRGTQDVWALGVPADIGRMLEEVGVEVFEVELTEDGLLYRPRRDPQPPPSWLRK